MRAQQLLQALGMTDPGSEWGWKGIETIQGGQFVATGILTDPDGTKWKVRVESQDLMYR